MRRLVRVWAVVWVMLTVTLWSAWIWFGSTGGPMNGARLWDLYALKSSVVALIVGVLCISVLTFRRLQFSEAVIATLIAAGVWSACAAVTLALVTALAPPILTVYVLTFLALFFAIELVAVVEVVLKHSDGLASTPNKRIERTPQG